MRRLILALSVAATACLHGGTFHASAQKAEIESLRAQLAKTAKYYTEFYDLMNTELEALQPQYQAEDYEARDLVGLRDTTMEKMDAAYLQAVADYEEAVKSLQSYRAQVKAMRNEVDSMIYNIKYPRFVVPWAKEVSMVWEQISSRRVLGTGAVPSLGS